MADANHQCAVLGKPIAHSLSPLLHNAAYRALGLSDWRYSAHEVDSGHLPAFMASLDPSWAGLSLTMPLKKTVQTLGTPTGHWATRLKVANTAILDWPDGATMPLVRLYNTDVAGIRLAFEHAWGTDCATHCRDSQDAAAVILGNGSTAASALAACLSMGGIHRIVVAARHPDAHRGMEEFVAANSSGVSLETIPLHHVVERLGSAEVVISTLPAHAADPVAARLSESRGHVGGTLLDVAYDPAPSALGAAWRGAGGLAVGGEEMLLFQAMLQVRLMTGGETRVWRGGEPAVERTIERAMRKALQEVL